MRKFVLIFYYAVVQFLPDNQIPVFGSAGRLLRGWCIRRLALECGANVNINRRAYVGNPLNFCIGDHSGIGKGCVIANDTIIGRYVMMAPDVVIFSKGHCFNDLSRPMMHQGTTAPRPVTIGDDVWIGQRVMIMPGVNIGKGAILAAGSVVTKDVSEYAIVAGNPARQVKSRKDASTTIPAIKTNN